MLTKKELTPEEQKLYSELQKLAKRSNQRIVRLERETDLYGSFATKQLYDYLSANTVQGLTISGRVKVSKNYNLMQMKAIIKATEQFLEGVSTVKKVKQQKKSYEEKIGKPISYKQANVLYRSGRDYTWIYEYIPKSEFWGVLVPTAKSEGWDAETFIEQIGLRANLNYIDEEIRVDLEALYFYCM